MSTGDVRRPSLNKLVTKAAATDKPDPDVIEPVEDVRRRVRRGVRRRPGAGQGHRDQGDASQVGPAREVRLVRAVLLVRRLVVEQVRRLAHQGDRDQDGCPYQWNSHQERPPRDPAAGRSTRRARAGQGRRRQGPQAQRPRSGCGPGVNWGPIAMFSARRSARGRRSSLRRGRRCTRSEHKTPWQERAAAIQGIHNYLASNPDWFKVPAEGNHKPGMLTYPTSPPVGGIHNPTWQNCMGDVYTARSPRSRRPTAWSTARSGSRTGPACPRTRSTSSPARCATSPSC